MFRQATTILGLASICMLGPCGCRRHDHQPMPMVVVGGFTMRVASKPDQLQNGLMGVTNLPSRTGMIFDLGRPMEAMFWMKNCLIPLDMVFMGEDGTVQGIRHALPPPKGEDGPYYTAIGAITQDQYFRTCLPKSRFVAEVPMGEGLYFAHEAAPQLIQALSTVTAR